jgi:DNA-binding NarL/FixJ family response regulator
VRGSCGVGPDGRRLTEVGAQPSGRLYVEGDDGMRDAQPARTQGALRLKGSGAVTVVLGSFWPILERGLVEVLAEDQDLRVIASGVDDLSLECVVAVSLPRICMIDERSALELSLLGRVRSAQPAINLLVLAARPNRAYRMRLAAAGATCVPKDSSPTQILGALRVGAGDSYLRSSRAAAALRSSDRGGSPALTKRELAVLQLLAVGQTNPEIALTLHIALETARTHVARVKRKLKVNGRRELFGMDIAR